MDEPNRRFEWSNHAGKIVLASPCLAAAVTWAVVSNWNAAFGRPPLPLAPGATMFLIANGGIAVAGSALGGLLIRAPLYERVGAAFAAGLFGLVGYSILAVCPFGPPTH